MSCHLPAADFSLLGLASQPEAAAVAGAHLLAAVALLAAAAVTLHIVAGLLWSTLPRTRHHPLPSFLVPPALEFIYGSVLVLPLGLASVLLLAAPGRNTSGVVLGAAGLLALSSYLGLVGAALLGVARSRHRWASRGSCLRRFALGCLELATGLPISCCPSQAGAAVRKVEPGIRGGREQA